MIIPIRLKTLKRLIKERNEARKGCGIWNKAHREMTDDALYWKDAWMDDKGIHAELAIKYTDLMDKYIKLSEHVKGVEND